MRKLFPMLLFTLLLALLMAVPALAADFTYDDFSATLTVPDSYTMVTTSNLADHEDLLAKQGLTIETAQADWAARAFRHGTQRAICASSCPPCRMILPCSIGM